MPRTWRAFVFRFTILILIALVPLLLAGALATPNAGDLKEIAQRTANEFDRLLQLRQQQVFTIATFPSIRAFASSTAATRSQRAAIALNELQAWVASDTNVREAFIVDNSGTVIMTTLEGWNANVGNREFVQEALSGQLAASAVARDRGEFSNYYAAPILDNSKEIAGALVIRVAAQELWDVTPRGSAWYAVLSDENGVRLDDTGDPARRLFAFAPLDAARAAIVSRAQIYGAEGSPVRATNLVRAQQLLTQGALDQLHGSAVSADAVAAQRLVAKPWAVLVIAPQPTFANLFERLLIPLVAAILLAIVGAFLLQRL